MHFCFLIFAAFVGRDRHLFLCFSQFNDIQQKFKDQIQMELTSQIELSQVLTSTIINNFSCLDNLFDFKPFFKLLYRASDHQFSVKAFHQLCDDIPYTLVLCKTHGKCIFGGYTPLKWDDQYQKLRTHFKTDKTNSTFLFSVTKNQKYPLKIGSKNKAICCSNMFGPTFCGGYDIQIRDKADIQYSSISYFPRNFQYKNSKANHEHITGAKGQQFRLMQWQVYKVMKFQCFDNFQKEQYTQQASKQASQKTVKTIFTKFSKVSKYICRKFRLNLIYISLIIRIFIIIIAVMQQRQSQNQAEYEYATQKQIQDYYKSQQSEVQRRFKQLSTDTLEQIKNNMKRRQNRISKQQNLNLIENQRSKIIAEMKEHLNFCFHPQCREIKQMVVMYGFSKGLNLKDHVSYIANKNIQGLSFQKTDCLFGTKLNQKMDQTHKIMKGI